jgi:hypothetical protein
MTTTLDPRIEVIRERYGLAHDDFWKIKQNGQWVCKHAALEVVAVKAEIEWLPPMIIEHDAERLVTSMVVTGKMGKRVEWATGETNPTNYSVTGKQPAYPWAMSEKRAKDRVVLKLVGIHGLVYSEDEMPSAMTTDAPPSATPLPDTFNMHQKAIEAAPDMAALKAAFYAAKADKSLLKEEAEALILAKELRKRQLTPAPKTLGDHLDNLQQEQAA